MDLQTAQQAAAVAKPAAETVAQAYAILGGIVAIIVFQIRIAIASRASRREGRKEYSALCKTLGTQGGKIDECISGVSRVEREMTGVVATCIEHRKSTERRLDSAEDRLGCVENRQFELARNGQKAGMRSICRSEDGGA